MSEIGEKAYLRALMRTYARTDDRGVMDDDAVVTPIPGSDLSLAFSIDRGPAAVAFHFGLGGREVDGRLAATACISDIIAVGADPWLALLAISMPPDSQSSDADLAIGAFARTCELYATRFAGGDLKKGPWNMTAACVGVLSRRQPYLRKRGQPGDLILVAGEIGNFTSAVLEQMGEEDVSPEAAKQILSHPTLPTREAAWLRDQGVIMSATDASDGVYEAIQNVLSPGTGAILWRRNIPFSALALAMSARTGIPLLNFVSGAGDWNFVYCANPSVTEAMERLPEGLHLSIIGRVVDRAGLHVADKEGDTESALLYGLVSDHFIHRAETPNSYIAALRSLAN